ncbi:hypothetical protein [Changchengzhania lutea]|uniref:hypothetical protein n=1 Tax=Changchengzhania lutea TaxID=2049305 RepID=UPI00115F2A23|nr:hypothetical protein [Changchengzhania lutea]
MKSSIDIASKLYKVLNVASVTDEITGKVYINDVPDGDQLENISVKTLTNPNRYLQVGYANLNIYVPEVISGRANLNRFQDILAVVLPLVKDNIYDGLSFQIDDDKGIFKDKDRDSMYFYNLKLTFQTL